MKRTQEERKFIQKPSATILNSSDFFAMYGLKLPEKPFHQGSFGVLYSLPFFHDIFAGKNRTDVVMKILFGRYGNDPDSVEALDLYEELELARSCSLRGIGPEVYLTGVMKDERFGDLEGVIIMERFYSDLSAYQDICSHPIAFQEPLSQLFYKLAEGGVLCYDLKPQNVVLNYEECRILKTRLIDIGMYCSNTNTFQEMKRVFGPAEGVVVAWVLMLAIFDRNEKKKFFSEIITSNLQRVALYSSTNPIKFLKDLQDRDRDLQRILRDDGINWDSYHQKKKK